MSKINRHPVRRTAAGVLAGALALTGAVAFAAPATALPTFGLERIEGANRYVTSANTALAFGNSTGAILASGENNRFPDALSASFLAGVRNVPVLLTQRNSTPGVVLAAMRTIGVRNVTIVGGTDVVTTAQENALTAAGFTVTRLAGDTRYDTSRQVIAAGQASAAPIGIVATGENFPDALGAGPLAFKGKHPLFLVNPTGIPGGTLAALRASGIKQVIVIGGDAAVTPAVRTALTAEGVSIVTTLAGPDRSTTSARIADYLFTQAGWDKTTFNVATGVNGGVDALGGAALSGKQSRALLITNTPTSAAPVVDFAARNANTLSTVGTIFGGTAAVSTALEAAIEAAGRNRGGIALTATSVGAGSAITGTISGDATSVTVSGSCITGTQTLTDSDATAAGRQFSVATIGTTAPGNCVLTFTSTFAGGVTETVTQTVAITAVTSNQTFTVTPRESATLTLVADETSATATSDDRVYTVTNAVVGAVHQIRLVNASNITVAANGQVTFTEAGTTNTANFGAVQADITAVNGVPNGAGGASATITPTTSTFTFRVDGEVDETVVPVVFFDANTNGQLDLNANDTPVTAESFGAGGATNFNPTEAVVGALTGGDAAIGEVDKTANVIVSTAGTLEYDDNDNFFVVTGTAGNEVGPAASLTTRVTLAQFEAQLSQGDELETATEYAREAAFASTFVLEDITPVVTGTPTLASRTASSLTLTVPGRTTGSTVKVYGEVDPAGGGDATVTTDDTVLATSATDADANTAGFQIVVSGLPAATTYDLAVSQTVDGEESGLSAELNDVATQSVLETAPPTVTNAAIVTDAAPAGLLTDGDTFVLDFNEALASTAGTLTSSFVRVSDADSTYSLTGPFTLSNGPGSTGANDRLLVNVEAADLTTQVAGTNNGLDFAGGTVRVVLLSADFDDLAGNQVDLAGSADVIVDNEGAVDATSLAAPTASPANNATAVNVAVSPTATYGENPASGTAVLATQAAPNTPIAGAVDLTGAVITFNPNANLTASTAYTITYTAQDAAGNVTTTAVNFTTA